MLGRREGGDQRRVLAQFATLFRLNSSELRQKISKDRE